MNVVTRSNGQKRSFSTLIRVLSVFDREDLDAVYKIVMDIYQDKIPEARMESRSVGSCTVLQGVLNSPCFLVKSWLVQDQTVLGKDYSNLLIADSLLKTIWFINAPCYGNEALASPKANDKELSIPEQTATGKGTSNPLMAGEMQAVPPPMTGNYLPSGPDIEIDDSQYTYGPGKTQPSESESQTTELDTCDSNISTEPSELVSEPVVNESNVEVQPKVWSDAPIIEEYESDSDDEYVSVQTKGLDTPSFANKQVKTPRENVKNQSTHSQKPKVNNKELGHGFTERACFVWYKGEGPTWNNVQRVNKQNQFVPLAVQTRTGINPVNTAKASSTNNFSTARQKVNKQTVLTSTALKVNTVKPIVNGVRPANVFHKTHSPSSRPFKRTTVLRTNFSNQKVYTAKVKEVSTVGEKWDTAVKSSAGCKWRTPGYNKNILSKYNGGSSFRNYSTSRSTRQPQAQIRLGPLRENKANLARLSRLVMEGPVAFGSKTSKARRKKLIRKQKLSGRFLTIKLRNFVYSAGAAKANSTNIFSTVSTIAKASGTNLVNTVSIPVSTASPNEGLSLYDTTNSQEDDSKIPPLEDIHEDTTDGIFTHSSYDDGFEIQSFGCLVIMPMGKRLSVAKWVYRNKKGVKMRSGLLEAEGSVLAFAPRIWALSLSDGFEKVPFSMAKIDEEVMSSQPPVFKNPKFLRNLQRVKPLYGLHQAAQSMFQVTPKTSHLSAVKRIFRYLKGKPKLGLWYPRESSFDLESYSDSDYAGANLDRKSTTGGCQFLGRRLVTWQCKKQTIVATSTTEAEYVAAASCCGQVLYGFQKSMLDYGFNFMNTKIYIDNESTICIVKNPVYHSKTKHIAIRHHFIRDAYEKKLMQSDEDFIAIGSVEDDRLITKMNKRDSSKGEVIKQESKEEVKEEDKGEENTRKRKHDTRKKISQKKNIQTRYQSSRCPI
ncbi:hypothetical protein Tco_0697969 [Tanacetum coccineum]